MGRVTVLCCRRPDLKSYQGEQLNTKRESVLSAATALFSKNGYHAVGVDSIVTNSNVAKMTFYKYFPSKENLIENVLYKRDHDLRLSILDAMSKRRTPKTKIKALFDWYEGWFQTPDFYGCMFIKAVEEHPDLEKRIRKVSQDHKSWLEGELKRLLKECNVKAPGDMAIFIMMVLDGLTVRANMFKGDAKDLVQVAWRQVDGIIKPA